MDLLYADVVKLPIRGAPLQPRIARNARYRWFQNCVGAVDCTHIKLRLPNDLHAAYRNRKGDVTHNVFAACNFDMAISFCAAGGEGSASDNRIFDWAMGLEDGFQLPPGCYMLADQGFEDCPGLLTPYPATRYHLSEWARGSGRPQNKKELFNLRHCKLRNVIERAFGVLKRKFAVLRDESEYDVDTQIRLVYAAVALHNFIIQSAELDGFDRHRIDEHNQNERNRRASAAELALIERELNQLESQAASNRAGRAADMLRLRDVIAEGMWTEYQRWLQTQQAGNSNLDEESEQSDVE